MAEHSSEPLDEGIRYLRRIAESEGPYLFTPPREREPAPERARTQTETMSSQQSLGGDLGPLPWSGSPPRPEVDPVGIPPSMVEQVPTSAPECAAMLSRLDADICSCLKCPLGESRSRFVFGVGNPDATLMLVGEAPGAEEDRQGEPFVGKAGQLLNRILAAIEFAREEVYIANILKCRPPNNRDPQAGEVDACEPYLQRQIDLIRPAVICALGRIAGQTLLRTSASLTALRGKVHQYRGRPLVVTYHPAALLRNPNWKKPTWEDVQMLRRIHDERVGR